MGSYFCASPKALARSFAVAGPVLILLFVAVAFGHETDFSDEEEDIWGRTRVNVSTSVGVFWQLPTVRDKEDRRYKDGNDIKGYLRGASMSFRGDLAKRLEGRISLSAAERSEFDLDQDDANDDPDAGKLVTALTAANAAWYLAPYLRIRAGLIPLPWSSLTNATWGYSFAASSASRRYGLTPTYDLGLHVHGDLPRRSGSYALAFVNGERRRRPETNRYKAVHGVLSLRPLPFRLFRSMTLSGCAIYEMRDDPPGDELDRRVAYGGLLHFPFWYFRFGAEGGLNLHYDSTAHGPRREGIASIYLTAEPSWNLGVFLRADARDPDMSQRGDKESTLSSRIRDQKLTADEDRRYEFFAGANHQFRRGLSFGGYFRARFFEEIYQGDSLPPTLTLHAVTTVSF